MRKAMIITMGGSPEPIAKTILAENHQPEFICFLASDKSVNDLGKVLKMVKEQGHDYEQTVVISHDAEDLVKCYRTALECIDRMEEKGYDKQRVLVDYTGGTKTMTAAIALATIGKGYNFSYVGGKDRTKGGLGIVKTGSELIKEDVGPWHLFAIEEKRALSLHINSYRFDAALEIIKELDSRGKAVKGYEFLKPLNKIIQGYREWEAFRHKKALELLEKGAMQLRERLEVNNCQPIRKYLNGINSNFEFLQAMKRKTDNFTLLSAKTVTDLLSNAERRAEEGKYDDATARVYRALEMIGQIEFVNEFGCETGKVEIDKIPVELQPEYSQKYLSEQNSLLKLPLEATFKALKAKGNKKGTRFFENISEIKKLQSARNNSILAHGVESTSEKGFERMLKFVRKLFIFVDKIEFPRLEGDW